MGSEVWCCASAGVASVSLRLAAWSGESSGGLLSTALQQCLSLRLLFKTVVNSFSRISLQPAWGLVLSAGLVAYGGMVFRSFILRFDFPIMPFEHLLARAPGAL